MKKIPVFLLCLLFLTLCRVNAQEVFAPLISENCVAFVHVDFSSLETDKIKGTLQKADEDARKLPCMNKMKMIGLAIHNFHDARGELPPLYTVDKDGKPLHSWRVLLLPYMEQIALYEQIRLNEPWDSEYNKQFHDRFIEVYSCPNCPRVPSSCNYSAIAGEGFVPAKKAGETTSGETFARLEDGLSNTIAIIEVKEPFCWMDPTADVTLDELAKGINKDGRCGSYHPHGCFVLLFDGGVHSMPEEIETKKLRALATPAGGESVSF